LDRAISNLKDFSWLIFTSMNGVEAFFKRLYRHGFDARALEGMRIAVIGPATAKRLMDFGLRADVMADSFRAEGLIKKLSKHLKNDEAVLIARAAKARSVLPEELKKRGVRVVVAACYRSEIPAGSRTKLKRLIRDDPPDLLTFASSSMVDNFADILRKDRLLWNRARKIPTACIGPITTQSAKDNKLNVVVQPKEYTIPDLVDAIRRAVRKF
jgi:uroporphyrinogen III methyltransferase/synthase